MRDDAVEAVVGCTGGGDDHFSIAFAQAALAPHSLRHHERIVVSEEGAPFSGSASECHENIRDEPRFFLCFKNARLDVVWQ